MTSPDPLVWLQLMAVLALEAGIFVGLAAVAQRFIASPAWRRLIWQICFIGLMLALLAEFTGVSRGLAGWTTRRLSPEPNDSQVVQGRPEARAPAPLDG